MKKIVILPSFERSIKKFTSTEKDRLIRALEKFNDFLVTGRISSGLGFKKIRHDIFEFRINIRLRVIVKDEDDTLYMVLAGSHEDIKRIPKRFSLAVYEKGCIIIQRIETALNKKGAR